MKQIYGLILDNGNLVLGKSKSLDKDKIIIKEGTMLHPGEFPSEVYGELGRYNKKVKGIYTLNNLWHNTGRTIHIPMKSIHKPYDLLKDENESILESLGLHFI